MILNLPNRLPVDPRGKISSGGTVKATSKDGKEYERPIKFDYFDLSDFAELRAVYGDKPKELVVAFPSDNPDDFFAAEYAAWGRSAAGATKKRTCDGETCVIRLAHKVGAKEYGAGEEAPCACDAAGLDDDSPERCKATMTMRAFLADPHSETLRILPTLFRFTSGYSSATNIRSELLRVLGVTAAIEGRARLTRIPFRLTVHMAAKADDAKSTFPVWNLNAQLAIGSQFFALKSPEGAPLLLSSGANADAPAALPPASEPTTTTEPPTPDALASSLASAADAGAWLAQNELLVDGLSEPERSEIFSRAFQRALAGHTAAEAKQVAQKFSPFAATLLDEYKQACRAAVVAATKGGK